MKHTEGKWKLRGNTIFVGDTFRSVASVHVIKNYEDITFKPIEDVEANANAEIICKAPLMYEAIQEILSELESTEGFVNVDWIRNRLNECIS